MMNINVNEVVAVVQIIDVAASRGAFRGDEMEQVGAIRNRFAAAVKAAQEAAAQPEAEQQAAE